MDLKHICPHCGQHVVFDGAFRGRSVQCPGCQKSIDLPQASSRAGRGALIGAGVVGMLVGIAVCLPFILRQKSKAVIHVSAPEPPVHQTPSFANDSSIAAPVVEERPLTEWLDDLDLKNEAEMRHKARDVIAQKAASQLPALIQMVENRTNKNRLRGNAVLAVGFAGSKTGPEAEVLISALADGDQYVRCCAMESLRQIRIDQKRFVTLITAMLEDPNSNVRRMAAVNLGYMGAAAKDTLPELKKLTGDESPATRAAADEAIKTINFRLAAPSR